MALIVGVDSYVTLTEADAYFDARLFTDPWGTTDDQTKEAALRMAAQRIETMCVRGVKAAKEQQMQFPRSLYSYATGRMSTEEAVTTNVKNAQCEEALAIIKGATQAIQRADLQRQGVTSFSLLSLSETYSGATNGSTNKLLSTEAARLMGIYTDGPRVIG